MTAHCMAINKEMFEAAGALQYVDLETHTWTTENFIKAVEALSANGQANVAAIFCNGSGGDQGTRALTRDLVLVPLPMLPTPSTPATPPRT